MSSLKLTLFGNPQVELNGDPVVFKTRKALALLVYLVLNPQPHSRETLATLFWPEFSAERAFANLRGALQSLTQSLDEEWFDIRRQEVQIRYHHSSRHAACHCEALRQAQDTTLRRHPAEMASSQTPRHDTPDSEWSEDVTLWVDVLDFQQMIAQMKEHDHSSGALCESCRDALQAALDRYRDDFLRGFTLPDCPAFDEWQALQTDRLRDQLIACFQMVIADATAQRDLAHALEYARRWGAACPWSEDAHRELMRTYAFNHQRSAALQQYKVCVRMLQDEFGAEPEQETQALYAAIVHDKLTPQPPLLEREGEQNLHPQFTHPHSEGEGDLLPSPLRRGAGGEVLSGGEVIPPHNLPAQTTSFIGREAEVTAVVKLLFQPDVRLLTLTGPGGSGKTRLSLQVATNLLAQYADGVFFVSLAPISDPDLVVSTIVTTLGLHVAGSTPPLEVLNTYLHSKQMLLVLDNFEQILAAAPVLNEMLIAVPGINIIVTSRTVLRISGEHEYLVPPLTLPDLNQNASFESLTHSEAVQLFAARATAMQPNFTLTAENTPIVAQICVRLDGLPLALELAAARINLFSPQALLNHLEHPLRLLTWGVRDLPARQQTLRATIAWSYHLLTPDEQTVFRRLAVFVGGWTLEAAEAVCALTNNPSTAVRPELVEGSGRTAVEGSGQVVDVLNGMQALVDHSLVREYEINGEPRLTMLETIREYALERLAESGEEEPIRQQYAQFFLALTENANLYWNTAKPSPWLARLDVEHDNLRAALAWSIGNTIELGLRLAGSLGEFWTIRCYDREGLNWLTQALTKSRCISQTGLERLQAQALHAASELAQHQNDLMLTFSLAEEALVLWRKLDDKPKIAHIFRILGIQEAVHRDRRRARILLEESIMLSRQIGDLYGLSEALWQYGYLLSREQEYEQARVNAEESLKLSRATGHIIAESLAFFVLGDIAMYQKDHFVAQSLYENSLKLAQEREATTPIAYVLTLLGSVSDIRGHYEQAKDYYEKGLDIARKRGDEFGLAWRFSGLGRVALHQRCWQAARDYFMESLTLHQKRNDKVGIAACLIGLAGIAEAQGDVERAAQLLGATETLPALATAPFKEDIAAQAEYDRLVAAVRNALGAEAFEAALAAGRALTLDQAIALVLTDAHLNDRP